MAEEIDLVANGLIGALLVVMGVVEGYVDLLGRDLETGDGS